MGWIDLFRSRPKLPRFSVNIYGKLPCHREYFYVSLGTAFTVFKDIVVAGVECFNRHDVPKPLINPNRRFFVTMPDHKYDLAGCLWDSSDGLRPFPFMMAVLLPKKIHQYEQLAFITCLESLWDYLEQYYEDLLRQTSAAEVYRRVRGIVHEGPELKLTDEGPSSPPALARFTELLLPTCETEEQNMIRRMSFQENPSFLLWPTRFHRDETSRRRAYVGFQGLADFDMKLVREGAEELMERPLTPNADDRK